MARTGRVKVFFDADVSNLERGTVRAQGALRRLDSVGSRFGTGISAASSKASSGLRNLDRALNRTRQTSIRLLRGLTDVSGVGMFGLSFGAAAAVREGLKFNSTMESNTIALKQFLGSGREARQLLGRLFEIAKKTPFEFPDLVSATRKFLAFGFSAEDAERTLKAVGGAVAGLGGGAPEIERITLALGQMQAKGKVSGEELLQLNEIGIPAQQILQKELKLTQEQVGNIGKVGITAKDGILALTRGMEERFAGATQAQAKSFSGQISTLKDNTRQALGAMTESLFKTLKGWLPAINKTTEDIAAIFKRKDLDFGEKVSLSIETAKVNLSPIFRQIKTALGKVDFVGALNDALNFAVPRIANAFAKAGLLFARALVRGFFQSDTLGKLLIGGWVFAKSRKMLGAFGLLGTQAGSAFAAGAAPGFAAGAAGGGAGGVARGAALGAGAGAVGGAAAGRAGRIIHGPEFRSGAPVSQLGQVRGRFGLGGLSRAFAGSPFLAKAGIVGAGFTGVDTIIQEIQQARDKQSKDLEKRLKALSEPGRARKVLGSAFGLAGGAFGGLFKTDDERKAKRLQEIIDQIEKKHQGITESTAKEADNLARQLSLTQQQRGELGRTLSQGRGTGTGVQLGLNLSSQLKDVKRLTPEIINTFSKQIEDADIPSKGKRQAARMLVEMARELKRTGDLKGSMGQLRNVIEAEVEGIGRVSLGGPRRLRGAIRSLFGQLPNIVERPTSAMAQIVATHLEAFGVQGADKINAAVARAKGYKGKASGGQQAPGGFAMGGFLQGAGRQDTVPIMAAPGEAVLNHHQQAPVQYALQQTYGIGLDDLFQQIQRPHFMAKGGRVGRGRGRDAIVRLGRSLQRQGFQVGEHPAFGGVGGSHVKGSYHYRGGGLALDINADNMRGGESRNLDRLAKQLTGQGWHIIWRAPGHFDHLHVDTASGVGGVGIGGADAPRLDVRVSGRKTVARQLAGAGLKKVARAANRRLGRASRVGLEDTGRPSKKGRYSKSRLAGLWTQAGGGRENANIMAAIALAESGGDPKAHGPPDGRGLWQIEWPIWRKALGKIGNPYNALANAKMAVQIKRRQGLGAWVVYNTGAYRKFLNRGGFVGRKPKLPRYADGGVVISYQDYSGKGVPKKKGKKGKKELTPRELEKFMATHQGLTPDEYDQFLIEHRGKTPKQVENERKQKEKEQKAKAKERAERLEARRGSQLDKLQFLILEAEGTPDTGDDRRLLRRQSTFFRRQLRRRRRAGSFPGAAESLGNLRDTQGRLRDLRPEVTSIEELGPKISSKKFARGLGAKAGSTLIGAQLGATDRDLALSELGGDTAGQLAALQRRGDVLKGVLALAQKSGDANLVSQAARELKSNTDALKDLTIAQSAAGKQVVTANKDIALASLTPALEDDIAATNNLIAANQGLLDAALASGDEVAITDAANALKGARDQLTSLQSAVEENTRAQNDLLKQQLQNAQTLARVSQSQYGALAQAISAVVSGEIGGKVGLGFSSPSYAGGVSRY